MNRFGARARRFRYSNGLLLLEAGDEHGLELLMARSWCSGQLFVPPSLVCKNGGVKIKACAGAVDITARIRQAKQTPSPYSEIE